MTGDEVYGEEGYTVVGTEHYTAAEGHGGLSVALFFLLGAAAGAGLGLLLTPQSGRRTRRQIKEVSRETRAALSTCSSQVLDKVGVTLDKGRELIREGMPCLLAAIEAGKEAYEREKAQRAGSET